MYCLKFDSFYRKNFSSIKLLRKGVCKSSQLTCFCAIHYSWFVLFLKSDIDDQSTPLKEACRLKHISSFPSCNRPRSSRFKSLFLFTLDLVSDIKAKILCTSSLHQMHSIRYQAQITVRFINLYERFSFNICIGRRTS